MAKAMTGVFTISASLNSTAAGYVTGAIPIGSLIDVGDAQALEIESVDAVYLNYDAVNDTYEAIRPNFPYATDVSFGVQLMDRNAGTWLAPTDNNIIASSVVQFDTANVSTAATDFFPDDFQKTNGRFVVNDELYITCYSSANPNTANDELFVGVRIRAKVVKLSTRDWMAISLETVQNE